MKRLFTEKKSVGEPRVETTWLEYTDAALAKAWEDTHGQGNQQARERGQWCVVIKMNRDEALIMTRMFVRNFAIPSCTHYDGDTLSMFCGHTGHTQIEALMERMEALWYSGCQGRTVFDKLMGDVFDGR